MMVLMPLESSCPSACGERVKRVSVWKSSTMTVSLRYVASATVLDTSLIPQNKRLDRPRKKHRGKRDKADDGQHPFYCLQAMTESLFCCNSRSKQENQSPTI